MDLDDAELIGEGDVSVEELDIEGNVKCSYTLEYDRDSSNPDMPAVYVADNSIIIKSPSGSIKVLPQHSTKVSIFSRQY